MMKKLMPMQSMIEKQSMNINEIPDVKELVRGYFCGKHVLNSSIVINKTLPKYYTKIYVYV